MAKWLNGNSSHLTIQPLNHLTIKPFNHSSHSAIQPFSHGNSSHARHKNHGRAVLPRTRIRSGAPTLCVCLPDYHRKSGWRNRTIAAQALVHPGVMRDTARSGRRRSGGTATRAFAGRAASIHFLVPDDDRLRQNVWHLSHVPAERRLLFQCAGA